MSLIKANAVQIGQSPTATQNFTLAVPSSPDGTIKLARGNSGATTQDVMNVSNAGVVSFPQGLGNISNSTVLSTGSTTSRSLANRFADAVNVKDFGAVGNGNYYGPPPVNWVDDTAAIKAAISSTLTSASGAGIYIPRGVYKITETLVIPQECGPLIMSPNAYFDFFLPNPYDYAIEINASSQPYLSTLRSQNGNGIGIKLYDTLYATVNFEQIQYFKGGIDLVANNQVCYNNNVNFCLIDASEFGIRLRSESPLYSVEGNEIKGNFLVTTPRAIWLKVGTGCRGVLWNNIELNLIHVTLPSDGGIYFERQFPTLGDNQSMGYNRIFVKTYFDMDDLLGAYQGPHIGGSLPAPNSGFAYVQTNELDMAIPPTASKAVLNAIGDFRLTLRGEPQFPGGTVPPLQCPTSPMSQPSFNGGIAVYRPTIYLRHTWTGTFGPGTVQSCYFYHVAGTRTQTSTRKYVVNSYNANAKDFKIDVYDNSQATNNEFLVLVQTLNGASGPINIDFTVTMLP